MARSKKNGMSDAQIMRERLLNMIEYLSKLNSRPKTIKEVAQGMDLIWATSAFIATRDLRRLIDSKLRCPNGVPVPQFIKARGLARSIIERCEKKKEAHIDACYRGIVRMFYKRGVLLGRDMHQADILRAMQPEGYGFPTTRKALAALVKKTLMEVKRTGKMHYYRLSKMGEGRAVEYTSRNEGEV